MKSQKIRMSNIYNNHHYRFKIKKIFHQKIQKINLTPLQTKSKFLHQKKRV